MQGAGRVVTLVDAHVHVYPYVPIARALEIGVRNLGSLGRGDGRVSSTGMLLVADPPRVHFGQALREAMRSGEGVEGWLIEATNEAHSVIARRANDVLVLILGQQLATAEKLEVLAFGTGEPIDQGLSIAETLAAIAHARGVGVVPWGLGKWSGERGRLVARVIEQYREGSTFLGDNGGRPRVWPVPQFESAGKLGIRVLRGTDPLPVNGDEQRIGTFGFCVPGDLAVSRPLERLTQILADSRAEITPLGDSASFARAISNQVRLRLRPVVYG